MEFKEVSTKSIRHLWSVICSSSVLNADNNNLSLNNLIEKLTIPVTKEMVAGREKAGAKGYAIGGVPLEIVTRLQKKVSAPVTVDLRFDFINPKGVILAAMPANSFVIQKDIRSFRIRSNMSPIPLDVSGEYTIEVHLREKGDKDFILADRIPVDVTLNEVN